MDVSPRSSTTSLLSLPPEAEDVHLAPSPRRPESTTSRRACTPLDVAVGAAVGAMAATLPVALAASPRAIHVLAPATSQALTTLGATVAGFSHVSALRRSGGDPHGYSLWRAAGMGTAIATPVLGVCTQAWLAHSPISLSLLARCALPSAAVVGSGMWLQTVWDQWAHDAAHARRLRQPLCVAGGLLIASIVWQVALLGLDTYCRVREAGGVLPGSARGVPMGVLTIGGGALLAALGAVAGVRARARGHEAARVLSLTGCVLGLLTAIAGASLLVPSRDAHGLP